MRGRFAAVVLLATVSTYGCSAHPIKPAGCDSYLGDHFVVNDAVPQPLDAVKVGHELTLRDRYLAATAVERVQLERRDVLRPGSWYVRDVDNGKEGEVYFGFRGQPFPFQLAESGVVIIVLLRDDLDGPQDLVFGTDSIWAAGRNDVVDLNPSAQAIANRASRISIAAICGNAAFGVRKPGASLRTSALSESGIVSPAQRAFFARVQTEQPLMILWWFFYKNAGGRAPFPTSYCSLSLQVHCLSPRWLQKQLGIFNYV